MTQNILNPHMLLPLHPKKNRPKLSPCSTFPKMIGTVYLVLATPLMAVTGVPVLLLDAVPVPSWPVSKVSGIINLLFACVILNNQAFMIRIFCRLS